MNTKFGICILFLLAFLFRIFLIPVARHGDLNNNTSWGQLLLTRGPVNFYESKHWTFSAPNQPPLYILLFSTTAAFQNNINTGIHWANEHISVFPSKVIWWFDQWGELYIVKLPGILADLAIGFVIYKLIKGKKGMLLAAVWLFNPVAWYNSAIWGGTDSIVNLLGVLSLVFLYKKNLLWSAVFFTLSILFKGSLLVFLPLWLIVAYKQHFSRKQWLTSLGVSMLIFLLVTIPFHPNIDVPVWFYRLYTERFLPGEIGTLTANAFNAWWLVDSGKVLDNTLFFGISARSIGLLITALLAAVFAWKTWKTQSKIQQLLAFALLSFVTFLFMTRIHERYLYPFFPLATVSLAFYPWLWIPYLILSFVHVFNLYHLFWAPGMPGVEAWYLNPAFAQALSALNVLFFAIMFALFITKKPLRHGK